MHELSATTRIYVVGVVAAAILVVVFGAYQDSAWGTLQDSAWGTLGVLFALFLVCESTPATLNAQTSVTLSFSAALASVVLLGAAGAALVGIAALFSVRRGPPLVKRAFNAAQFALCGYLAGVAFELLNGHYGTPVPSDFPRMIGPFAAATAVYMIVNNLLVGGVLALTAHLRVRSPRRFSYGPVLNYLLNYAAYATFGLLIAALWSAIGWLAAVLALTPIVVARWAFAQYAAQQAAHRATLAALCQAVETKDYYTRGHCMRVSKGSALIAEELSMRPDRVDAVRHAGMMHDVGKLGVPTRVLQKSGPLSEEEFAAIQLHPMRGLEIVREIGFLDEALAGILHHHERIDGRGYPMGLAGDEIPEFARVIGVADALDSMTSTRSYRASRSVPEAIEELRRCAGTHFDAQMVDALVHAIERDGWDPPRPIGPPDAAVHSARQDHDDPTAPLRVVRGGDI